MFPGCSQDGGKREVTLGTSVGWSDVYPSQYYQQWIDVTGLRGCFAYVHRADPKNHVWENFEGNNDSQRIVRLPWRGNARGCPGGRLRKRRGPGPPRRRRVLRLGLAAHAPAQPCVLGGDGLEHAEGSWPRTSNCLRRERLPDMVRARHRDAVVLVVHVRLEGDAALVAFAQQLLGSGRFITSRIGRRGRSNV